MRRLPQGMTAIVVLALVTAAGCATSTRGAAQKKTAVGKQFPTQEELEKVEKADPVEKFFDGERATVPTWKLRGPLPEKLGLQKKKPETPFESQLAKFAENAPGEDVVPSVGMHCLARQLGHFRLEHQAMPAGTLRHFMRSRCGTTAARFQSTWWTYDKKPKASPEEIARKIADKHPDTFARLLQGDHQSTGIWYGEDDDSAIVLVVAGRRILDLEPVPLKVEPGEDVQLRGRFLAGFEKSAALQTDGPFGSDECSPDRSVEAPKFDYRCTVGDEASWTALELVAYPGKRQLGRSVLRNFLWPTSADARTYRASPTAEAIAKAYQEKFGSEQAEVTPANFVGLLNAVRREAGREPVTLEEAQTKVTQRVANRFFQANYETNQRNVATKIALGLMAGWRVDGSIIDAGFSAQAVSSRSLAVVLEELVNRPMGRRAVLAADFDRVAAAFTDANDGDALGVMVTSYRPTPKGTLDERVEAALETINAEREDRGAPPLKRDQSLDSIALKTARRLESGEWNLRQAQKKYLEVAVQMWNTGVRGQWIATQNLDDFTLPKPLRGPGVSEASVMVVPYQAEDSAWTTYVILVVYRDANLGDRA